MESTNLDKNVGKLNPIAIADKIDEEIHGQSTIQRSGQNQMKIICQNTIDANLLIQCKCLKAARFKMYIPKSRLMKRGLIMDIDPNIPISGLVNRISPKYKQDIMNIKRRTNYQKAILDSVEITFLGQFLPRSIPINSFESEVFPIVLKPIRCFYCQRYRHTVAQCRSKDPTCEWCSGSHEKKDCEKNLQSKCSNCLGNHIASSSICPIYIREKEIGELRVKFDCGYREAEYRLNETHVEQRRNIPDTHLRPEPGPSTFYRFQYNSNSGIRDAEYRLNGTQTEQRGNFSDMNLSPEPGSSTSLTYQSNSNFETEKSDYSRNESSDVNTHHDNYNLSHPSSTQLSEKDKSVYIDDAFEFNQHTDSTLNKTDESSDTIIAVQSNTISDLTKYIEQTSAAVNSIASFGKSDANISPQITEKMDSEATLQHDRPSQMKRFEYKDKKVQNSMTITSCKPLFKILGKL